MSSRLGIVAVALALAACSAGSSTTSNASPEPSQAPTTAAPPAPTTPPVVFVADTKRDIGKTSGGPLGLKAFRTAPQTGYDRVVFELAGKVAGKPGWTVQYVDHPTSDGSGDPVPVNGSAFLEVILTGVGYPADTGVPEPTSRRVTPTGTPTLKEVVLNGVFEGRYTAFVGTSGKLPFRVTRLSSPERVVVDVRRS